MAFAYLYEPEIQYQTRDGRNNTNGFLRVYLAATDDPATTYSDFNGTLNQQDIRLDDDGRAVVIVDNSKAYRLEVYDPEGGLLFTCSPVTATGGGGGSGMNTVQVISTDGTVSVSSSTSAGTRYFDLSVAIDDNKPAKWADRTGSATSITGDGEWHELGNWVDIGTTTYYNGWQLYTDAGYDVAGSLEMVSGDADALSSIDVRFLVTLDGITQVEEFGRIDPTKDKDRVSFEWKQEGLDHQVVNARIFVKASEDMDVSLVSRACFNEEVNGIIGNGGTGGDYIAGEYIEIIGNLIQATGLQPLSGMSAYAYNSALSSKLDASASSEFYPTSNPSGFVTGGPYAYESAFSSFSSETTNNISSLSSIVSSISGQTGDFVEKSSISAESSKWNEVSGLSSKLDSSASSDFYLTSNPSGFITSADASTSFVYNSSYSSFSSETTSDISSLSSIVSAISGQTGDFVEKSSISAESSKWNEVSGLSSKLDSSASSDFYLTSNPSGFITSADASTSFVYNSSYSSFSSETTSNISSLSSIVSSISGQTGDFVEKSAISAESSKWNEVSGLSGKLDNSASSNFYPTSNPSGFVTGGPYAYESALSSKLDASASSEFMPATATGLFTGVVTDTSLSGNGMPSDPLGVLKMNLVWDAATMSSQVVGDTETAGVRTDVFQSPITYGYDGTSISSIDGSALAVPTGDFFTGVHTDSTLTGNGMSSSELGVNKTELVFDPTTMTASIVDDSAFIGVNTGILSSYAFESALSGYYPTSNPSGFISSVDLSEYATTSYVDSSVSGKFDASASGEFYPSSNPSGFITGVDLSEYVTVSSISAESSVWNSVTAKQDSGDYLSATESANYYSTSNPSGFITGVDLTPYQLTADMSAYQPSGDYQTAGNYLSSTDSAEFLLTSQSGLFQPSGNYQAAGEYLSATESSNYYPSSNPSGFVDSAYVEGQVSGKQDASAMTAYQPAGDYQPSGDYIYVSALGWAEVN